MTTKQNTIDEAFNSMLRADYISLADTEKLRMLSGYYVDYLGHLRQILSQNDQLIVGRRGTGKTTLLYRALVECMKSWDQRATDCLTTKRTLAIYLDLSKCQSLFDATSDSYAEFEHVFATELHDALRNELIRSWPAVATKPSLLRRIFTPSKASQVSDTRKALDQLSEILRSGLPRLVDKSPPVEVRDRTESTASVEGKASLHASEKDASGDAGFTAQKGKKREHEEKSSYRTTYRLSIADILRALDQIRSAADISHIILLIDEFSSLHDTLQRRFSTLLRKILGNHSGVFVKLSAITDNYALGSSIILQRDLFEVPLDVDAYIESTANLGSAMADFAKAAEQIVRSRLTAYASIAAEDVFDEPSHAWSELSRSAMGVPRTIGIVLKHAWHRADRSGSKRIRRTDVEAGIRYASRAYSTQLIGAADGGIAVPSFVKDIWDAILSRAASERAKGEIDASHFLVLPRHEEKLKYLNMFFLVHLLTRGRTTRKEAVSRNLYCIDYGVCAENKLGFATARNDIRQQRFVYDDVLERFDQYFGKHEEPTLFCPECTTTYRESELNVAGTKLTFCPKDKTDLIPAKASKADSAYTEEEIKIIGAMRSASPQDELLAREVADDVGCYIQKVSKFGEKLDKAGLIARRDSPTKKPGNKIYFKASGDGSRTKRN